MAPALVELLRMVTHDEIMEAELESNEALLIELRSSLGDIARNAAKANMLICVCRLLCRPTITTVAMLRPLEGYGARVRELASKINGDMADKVRRTFVFGAEYPFENDHSLKPESRWTAIRNNRLAVTQKEKQQRRMPHGLGPLVQRLQKLPPHQAVFAAEPVTSEPAAADSGEVSTRTGPNAETDPANAETDPLDPQEGAIFSALGVDGSAMMSGRVGNAAVGEQARSSRMAPLLPVADMSLGITETDPQNAETDPVRRPTLCADTIFGALAMGASTVVLERVGDAVTAEQARSAALEPPLANAETDAPNAETDPANAETDSARLPTRARGGALASGGSAVVPGRAGDAAAGEQARSAALEPPPANAETDAHAETDFFRSFGGHQAALADQAIDRGLDLGTLRRRERLGVHDGASRVGRERRLGRCLWFR